MSNNKTRYWPENFVMKQVRKDEQKMKKIKEERGGKEILQKLIIINQNSTTLIFNNTYM